MHFSRQTSAFWCCTPVGDLNTATAPEQLTQAAGDCQTEPAATGTAAATVARREEQAASGLPDRASRWRSRPYHPIRCSTPPTPPPSFLQLAPHVRRLFRPSTYRDSHFRALVSHHGHGRAADIAGTNATDAQTILLRRRHHCDGATGQAARGVRVGMVGRVGRVERVRRAGDGGGQPKTQATAAMDFHATSLQLPHETQVRRRRRPLPMPMGTVGRQPSCTAARHSCAASVRPQRHHCN